MRRQSGTERPNDVPVSPAMLRSLAAALTIATLLIVGQSPGAWRSAAQAAPQTSTMSNAAMAQAPRYITGFSTHCESRLRKWKIDKSHAEWIVENKWRSAYVDRAKGTWQYQSGNVRIALNKSGGCVTAIRKT